MRTYLYEMVTGGGAMLPSALIQEDSCLNELADFHQVSNLITDGAQMLRQLVQLYLNLPGIDVWVSVDSRLAEFGQQLKGLTNDAGVSPMVLFAEPQTPWAVFDECCLGADRTLIVAPELGSLLETAVGRCLAVGGNLLGPDRRLRELGIDKIALHRWADDIGLPMPAWGILENGKLTGKMNAEDSLLKPVTGTGGVGICPLDLEGPPGGIWLVEQRVTGIPVSVSVILTDQGPVLLPPCYQDLGGEHGFEFTGAWLVDDVSHQSRAWRLAEAVLNRIPLGQSRGWIGLDLMLGHGSQEDMLIEINPRITASIEVLSDLEAFQPYQWSRFTNVKELMFAATTGKWLST